MLDRLSAGVAQFGRDRSLIFFNQPFARLFALPAEFLADRPEFDRVHRCDARGRQASRGARLPRLEGRASHAGSPAGSRRMRRIGCCPAASICASSPSRCPTAACSLIFEDRTEQIQLASARDTLLRVRTATFDNLFEAVGVFAADGRLNLWNNRFREVWGFEEEQLASHPRVDALAPHLSRAARSAPSHAGLVRELVRSATVERKQRSGRVVDARRARVRIRRGAASRRQCALHHARHHRQPDGRGGAARAQRGARGGGPAEDRLRLQHELRAAHASDLDRRLRRDAVGGLCGRRSRRWRANMSPRSWTASRGSAR